MEAVTRPLANAYDEAYEGVPSWDIGEPQPAFVRLEEAGLIRDPVLDTGCGTGELSLFLARQGYDVLGIDISELAIRQAREKARARKIPVRFLVWDAMHLGRLASAGLFFATVVDCAMFHVLRERERDRLVEQLEQVVPRGGLYCVLGDARTVPGVTYGITPGEIQARFTHRGGWRLDFAYRTRFERRDSSNPAYLVGVRRA